MSKAQQKKKVSQHQRKRMIEEVFKKGKKQREIAKKFDAKIAQKQGNKSKIAMYDEKKRIKRTEKQKTRDNVADLDKKLDAIRAKLGPQRAL